MVVNIKFILENKNLDICVFDLDVGVVVVVNKVGKFWWWYIGNFKLEYFFEYLF